MELYKEILTQYLERKTANGYVENRIDQALMEIKTILEDERLEDGMRILKIKEIVCATEP